MDDQAYQASTAQNVVQNVAPQNGGPRNVMVLNAAVLNAKAQHAAIRIVAIPNVVPNVARIVARIVAQNAVEVPSVQDDRVVM
jgi:hypothetical protein